jgi:predicted RNase H-like HicB family nuclease
MSTCVYPVFIRAGVSGKYVAECSSIVGCHSQGDTIDDALANIREAIELCIEDMRERGEPLPPPATALLSEVAIEV